MTSPTTDQDAMHEVNVVVGGNGPVGAEPTVVTPLESRSAAEFRESAAKDVAHLIIRIFTGSLACTFLIILLLILLAFRWPGTILEHVIPALDNLTRFVEMVGAIFSPLLAFILGYYFSENKRR